MEAIGAQRISLPQLLYKSIWEQSGRWGHFGREMFTLTNRTDQGSYGIGVTRLIQTLIEQHADENGCRWPVTDAGTVAPFTAAIVPLTYDGDIRDAADRLHDECGSRETLLFDDPEQTIGERFAESDLLGIPLKVILGNTFLETGDVEVETRAGEIRYVTSEEVSAVVAQNT